VWRLARDAAAATRAQADGVARAWELGEASLADTLRARGDALDAQLAERAARIDAREAGYRLMLDAHRLWPVDAEEHAHE
jgi:outer membrane protein TolC